MDTTPDPPDEDSVRPDRSWIRRALLLLVGLACGLFLLLRWQDDVLAWEQASAELGLPFECRSTLWTIRGRLDGIEVAVDTVVRSIQRRGMSYDTRYSVTLPPLLFMEIEEEPGNEDGLDVDVGERAFDERFNLGASTTHRALAFLTVEERRRVIRLFDSFESCKITRRHVSCRNHGRDGDASQIVTDVRRLRDFAVRFVSAQEAILRGRSSSAPEPPTASGNPGQWR